jgi:stage II sporulation protein AB (anti-sigma F factor)
MKIENEMTLEFLSQSCNEAFARAVVGAFVAPLDPTMEELGDLKTVVSEAVTNCIVHAYPEQQGIIRLRCTIYEDRSLELQVQDQGVGIADIQAAREPMFTTGGTERSGMGFTIMERFMTSLQVESQVGQGTVVTMTRKLHRGGPYT